MFDGERMKRAVAAEHRCSGWLAPTVAAGCVRLGWAALIGLARRDSPYPAAPQIFKDGTVVHLDDYAGAPLSIRPVQISFSEQLRRGFCNLFLLLGEVDNEPGAWRPKTDSMLNPTIL